MATPKTQVTATLSEAEYNLVKECQLDGESIRTLIMKGVYSIKGVDVQTST